MSKRKSRFPPIEVRALRTKQAGTYERLLCQLLIASNNAEPLTKIRKMCEAMLRAKTIPQNPIKINEEEVEVIHAGVTAFRDTYHGVTKSDQVSWVEISWPFETTDENYKKYVAPWRLVTSLKYFPLLGYHGHDFEEVYDRNAKFFTEIRKERGEAQYFFTITTYVYSRCNAGALTESAFRKLRSQFITWALPKVEEWYLELTKLVEPSLFDFMFRMMYEQEKKSGEK